MAISPSVQGGGGWMTLLYRKGMVFRIQTGQSSNCTFVHSQLYDGEQIT